VLEESRMALRIVAGDYATAAAAMESRIAFVWLSMSTTSATPSNAAFQSARLRGFTMTDPSLK
jgi:hypothetical protein